MVEKTVSQQDVSPATKVGKNCISIFRKIYCVNCCQGEYLNIYNHRIEFITNHVTSLNDNWNKYFGYHQTDY
jgi:hypothetical protein